MIVRFVRGGRLFRFGGWRCLCRDFASSGFKFSVWANSNIELKYIPTIGENRHVIFSVTQGYDSP